MPATGTYAIDTRNTFSTAIFMGSGPRLEFGTTSQAVSAAGEKKWEAQLAVTFLAEHGMKPVSEVITVGLTGGATDPCEPIAPGTVVEVDRFRVGVSSPEKRDSGRIVGGKPWYQAGAIRPAGAQHGQPRKDAAA